MKSSDARAITPGSRNASASILRHPGHDRPVNCTQTNRSRAQASSFARPRSPRHSTPDAPTATPCPPPTARATAISATIRSQRRRGSDNADLPASSTRTGRRRHAAAVRRSLRKRIGRPARELQQPAAEHARMFRDSRPAASARSNGRMRAIASGGLSNSPRMNPSRSLAGVWTRSRISSEENESSCETRRATGLRLGRLVVGRRQERRRGERERLQRLGVDRRRVVGVGHRRGQGPRGRHLRGAGRSGLRAAPGRRRGGGPDGGQTGRPSRLRFDDQDVIRRAGRRDATRCRSRPEPGCRTGRRSSGRTNDDCGNGRGAPVGPGGPGGRTVRGGSGSDSRLNSEVIAQMAMKTSGTMY